MGVSHSSHNSNQHHHQNHRHNSHHETSSTSHGGTSSDTLNALRSAQSWSSLHEAEIASSSSYGASTITGRSETIVKKKRNLGLATLKKHLVRRARRASKSFDHSQVLRDFLSGWSTRDLIQLVEEYESTGLLKELSLQAEIARPTAATVAHDLSALYDYKHVTDTYLLFRGVHFPVHKSIVCCRCPFFRELLGKINTFGATIPVNLEIPGLRPELFNDLLRYLYSGELIPTPPVGSEGSTYDTILLRLSEQFGVPNDLDRDLRHLLETGLYSDASLVFSPGVETSASTMGVLKKCRACSDQSEYSCHTAVLAARSQFFRNVIQRHQRRFAELSSLEQINTANQKIRIVLDESIIPRRFARVILHAMYRDSTDLQHVLPHAVCKCYLSQSEVMGPVAPAGSMSSLGSSIISGTSGAASSSAGAAAAASGSTTSSLASFSTMSHSNGSLSVGSSFHVKDVMDLYEMARFLELDSLIQSCEDMIIDSLSLETILPILKWSEQPHGSLWVKRQTLHFMREEFATLSTSSVLFQLESHHLLEVVKSDYLQLSELEVLQSVIRWGENRLVKRMEEREPNVVSQTAHSLRRGVRKRDLNDAELRDIISELMGYVRIGHILPLDCETLTSAAKRGLISTLPPYMLGEDSGVPYVRGITSWLRGKGSGPFVTPRYFSPYVEEAKSYLEERLRRPGEIHPRRDMNRAISHTPDALYMVDRSVSDGTSFSHQQMSASSHDLYTCCSPAPPISCFEAMSHHNHQLESLETGASGQQEQQSSLSQLPVVDQNILLLMKQREQDLKSNVLGTLALVPNRCEITKLIELRIVREFGLPDSTVDVLHATTASFMPYPATDITDTCTTTDEMTASYGITGMIASSGVLSNLGSNGALASDKDNIYCYPSELQQMDPCPDASQMSVPPPPMPPPADSYHSHFSHYDEDFMGSSRHHMREAMPDIAVGMATSALAEMHLFKRSTESLALQPPPPQRPQSRGFDSASAASLQFMQ